MRKNHLGLVFIAAIGCRKAKPDLSPLEFLDTCNPGASSDACTELNFRTNEAFPAGRLAMIFHFVRTTVPVQPRSRDAVFTYSLHFDDAAGDVFAVLKSELGQPTNKVPEYLAKLGFGQWYWTVTDGVWQFGGGQVVWYSHPFHSESPDGIYGDYGHFDKYVYPAPQSASVFKKLALLLIGSDVLPVSARKP